ncbi:hypothetical protein [Accumulibacter sp.]|uniref:hypothetical protein n=1 Tax=Accumulibacter sp. TaxID=2053492 RepID=UPI00262145A4|nr:hypothetical protein [Accumulibacter sp.]
MTTQSPSVEIKVLLKRPMILLIVAVIFVFSLIGANIAGRQAARADIEKLETVWPFLDRLSEADRAFLAGLAMTCKLHRYGETQSEVVTCLRTAAADPSAILPNSVSQADAHDKLERMLDYAPGATSSGS